MRALLEWLHLMKTRAWRYVASWLLFASSFCVFSMSEAPFPQFNSRMWQTADGLPHNSVQAIVQTSDGYLWLGTSKGLARFDGVRFTTFTTSQVPASLANASITGLCETDDGGLWIATKSEGLIAFRNGEVSFHAQTNGLVCDSIRALCR